MMGWIFAAFFVHIATAQSQPAAIECVEKFISRMQATTGYSLHLRKGERFEGRWNVEPIELWSEGKMIRYKFVADGSTGIKNNGMELTYNGSDVLDIKWGEPTFLGAIANKAARAVTGHTLPLIDERTLKGEIFTLNRAGFRHLALILNYHLPDLRRATTGGVNLVEAETCKVKYTPSATEYTRIPLKPADRIQDIEEKYGTFAYHLQMVNATLFPTMESLFKHPDEVEIRVPRFFLPAELDIDPATGFPQRLILYSEEQKLGEYEFSNIKSW